MDAIVAVYSDWGIGAEGTQPLVIRADRAFFRRMTEGGAIIVGRPTMEDFPGGKPLEGRTNIVVTRKVPSIEGAIVTKDVQSALSEGLKYDKCFVIGGASIFMQLFPYLDRVYVTKIDAQPVSTAFFPNLDRNNSWSCVEEGCWQEEDGIRYCFCIYEKIK